MFPPDFGGFSKILGTLCRESDFFAPEKGVQKTSQRGERSRRCGPRGSQGLVSGAEPYVHCVKSDLAEKKTHFYPGIDGSCTQIKHFQGR